MFPKNLTNNWEEGYGDERTVLLEEWSPYIGNGTILEDFHSAGSWPVLIERLKREAREGVISTANAFSIQAEMQSGPLAECCLVLSSRF